MTLLRAALPPALVLLLALVAALPFGMRSELRFVLPMLPAFVVLAWNTRRRNAVPEWGAFLAGLLLDAVSQGPLGYWALLYLVAYVLAALLRGPADEGAVLRWARFVLATVLLGIATWSLLSVYSMQPADVRPLLNAVAAAALIYLPLAALIALVEPKPAYAASGHLVRGS